MEKRRASPPRRQRHAVSWPSAASTSARSPAQASEEAERFLAKLRELLAKFSLELHAEKTWLRQVVSGYTRYYGVPMNSPAIALFRFRVGWLWNRALARRSHTAHVAWERMRRLIKRWLPPARICHAYPLRRLGVLT
jgi:hypothetical protein